MDAPEEVASEEATSPGVSHEQRSGLQSLVAVLVEHAHRLAGLAGWLEVLQQDPLRGRRALRRLAEVLGRAVLQGSGVGDLRGRLGLLGVLRHDVLLPGE